METVKAAGGWLVSALMVLLACNGLWSLIGDVFKTKANRKAQLEDREAEKAAQEKKNAERLDRMEQSMAEMRAYIEAELGPIARGLAAVTEAEKQDLKDRLTRYCKDMITAGSTDFDDYENLKTLHAAYERLGGNGDIDDLMERVKALPITDRYGRKDK